MRLFDTRTGRFVWIEVPKQTSYAILSHVWSREPGGELTYEAVKRIQDQVHTERAQNPDLPENEVLSRLSPKIRGACQRAQADGIDLIWIDAVCIDVSSSAEISEAVNSAYSWYEAAKVCYAFLHDVDSDEDPSTAGSAFRSSVWFTRGWTLQELIAPRIVIFFASDWKSIGGKHGLASVIQKRTGIDESALIHTRPLSSFTVAQRMFWASKRVTTRVEDEAYCLMGMFNINMPTIYGEGTKAFLRLQEKILKTVPDQTIFVWDWNTCDSQMTPRHDGINERCALLATSPRAFTAHSASVRLHTSSYLANILSCWNCAVDPVGRALTYAFVRPSVWKFLAPIPTYTVGPYGIRVALPFVRFRRLGISAIPLTCSDREGRIIMLLVKDVAKVNNIDGLCIVGYDDQPWGYRLQAFRRWPDGKRNVPARLMTVSIKDLKASSYTGGATSFVIAHRPSVVASLLEEPRPPNALGDVILADMSSESPHFQIVVYPRTFAQLEKLGYTPSLAADNILRVSLGAHRAVFLEFYIWPIMREARGERVAHALCASFETSFVTYNASDHEELNPVGGSSTSAPAAAVTRKGTAVECWGVSSAGPRPGRSEIFPLPARELGVEPERMRLTVVRETPGSTEYPSMFSLKIEVLTPEVKPAVSSEDDAKDGGLGEGAQPEGGVGRRAVKHLRSKIFGKS